MYIFRQRAALYLTTVRFLLWRRHSRGPAINERHGTIDRKFSRKYCSDNGFKALGSPAPGISAGRNEWSYAFGGERDEPRHPMSSGTRLHTPGFSIYLSVSLPLFNSISILLSHPPSPRLSPFLPSRSLGCILASTVLRATKAPAR